tara:strand:+ start:355 stop:1077 length:723 start_codon:yes stop_codon:yes gene_type:complete
MKKKIIAMIPARIGSERLKYKNLALINKKPLIYYAIDAAKKSKVFDKVVLNSDDIIFKKIAIRYNIDFYLRPKKIGLSKIKSDDVVYDFLLKNKNFDIIVWVNPIAPLLDFIDIQKVVNYFKKNKLHSLITSEKKKVHALYKKKPINFVTKEKFKKTQDLEPVKFFSYTLMMWNSKKFLQAYKKRKSAILCGKFSDYALSAQKSIIIKDKNDLKLAEQVMKNKNNQFLKVTYDKLMRKNV